jgi:hypothetical protein
MQRKLGFVVLAGVLLGLAGCGTPLDANQFNSKVVMGNKKLAKAASEFRTLIQPLEKGQAPSMSEVNRARDKLTRVFDEVRRDFESITPTDSTPGQNLYDAYKKFLMVEERLIRDEFGTKLTQALNTGGNAQAKWAAVKECFDRVKSTEEAELESVKSKQRAFAKAHNIQLGGGMGGMPMGGH